MKYFFIIIFLTSCAPQFHINRAKKHTEKAIDKGAVFTASNDTTYINDTIVTVKRFTVNDTVYIETVKTVEKIVTTAGEIRYITKKDKRKEVRQEKVEAKRAFKLAKEDKKVEKVKARKSGRNGSLWYILLIVASIIIVFYYENKQLEDAKKRSKE